MSVPASKRRKLDNNVLFKPFKSPLKTTTEPSKAVYTKTDNSQPEQAQAEDRKLQPPNVPKWAPARSTDSSSRNLPFSNTTKEQLGLLRREEAHLRSRLSKLRIELDQIKQAKGIEDSARDEELLNLIKIWKSATQQAAEEVYASVRDKINSVGGMRRWREMERERRENAFSSWGLDEEGRQQGKDDEYGVDGEDKEDDDDVRSSEGKEETSSGSSTNDKAETFTMEVMLRYLSIRPEVIGYDVDGQRWLT